MFEIHNRIPGVMINVLPTSVVDHGFKPQSGQTKDYNKNVDIKFSAHDTFLEILSQRERNSFV
jgi:hypothetical protein